MKPVLILRHFAQCRQVFRNSSQVTHKAKFLVSGRSNGERILLQQMYTSNRMNTSIRILCSTASYTELDKCLSDELRPHPIETGKKEEIMQVVKFLESHGCSTKDIKEKCLKHIRTTHNTVIKTVHLSELHSNIVMLMPLLSLSPVLLRTAARQARDDKTVIEGFPNRIEYLSHHLETDTESLVAALIKHHSLLTMPFRRLKHKMMIMKDAGISPKYLMKDLWIFNYNEMRLVGRISTAEKAEVELKPWMLRCSENIFKTMLVKNSETLRILKGNDEISYLAEKLDCGKEYVEYMMEKNKLLKTINIPKLEQVINFLYDKGYTPQEVRLFPRVFCSSVQTLSKRFDESQKLRSTLPTISQLCITNKTYKRRMEKESNTE